MSCICISCEFSKNGNKQNTNMCKQCKNNDCISDLCKSCIRFKDCVVYNDLIIECCSEYVKGGNNQ